MYALTRNAPLAAGLDGLFDELFREPQPLRVDVRETAQAYVVLAELPGVKKDQVEVEIEANEVAIVAEIGKRDAREGDKWLRLERFQGRTGRRFALPQEIDEAKADAKLVDGVLELTLPKKAPAAGRKIEVQ
jgi:HSP20 family protein